MKIKFVLIFLIIMILSTGISSASTSMIIKKETIEYVSAFSYIGLGDRIDKIFYSDGTNETILVRFKIPLLSLSSYPTSPINIEYGEVKDITIPVTLNGWSCGYSKYDNLAKVNVYTDTGIQVGGSGDLYIPCGKTNSVNIIIPGNSISSWFTQSGSHTLVLKNQVRFEGRWLNDGNYNVYLLTSIPLPCPQYSPPLCPNGTLIPQGLDANGCQKPPICSPTVYTLWWYDNEHSYCQNSNFTGSYTYPGLHTFPTKTECEVSLLSSQKCSDGTLYNSCSLNKPLYCDSSITLINKSSQCGCPSDMIISGDTCVISQPPPAIPPIDIIGIISTILNWLKSLIWR